MRTLLVIGACVAALVWGPAGALGQFRDDGFGNAPSLLPPKVAEIRQRLESWLDEQDVPQAGLNEISAIWETEEFALSGEELLRRLAASVGVVDDRARRLVELCARSRSEVAPPAQDWLDDPQLDALVRNNLRLLYGRWLVRERMYDEALAQLGDLSPEEVVDPATLLFYQAVAFHRLLDRERGLEAVRRLMGDVAAAPQRYQSLAILLEADLAALEDESLDHISRRMDDIRRRLDLGRAGEKVRTVEDGVIESLDKLIDDLEQQQQQQQASNSGGSQSQPSQPLPDSTPVQLKGAGEVDERIISAAGGWGNLPPKQRESVLQQIGRDFPAHYREVIEQYFRETARQGSARDGRPPASKRP